MNEQHNDLQPPIELPKPQAEISNNPAEVSNTERVSERRGAQSIEQGVSHPSLAAQSPIAVPALQSAYPTKDQGVTPSKGTASTDTSTLIADDVDLIEKEWVYKAKEIVEKTKTDPHDQSKKMNEVKAGYLKKRYNKELELAED